MVVEGSHLIHKFMAQLLKRGGVRNPDLATDSGGAIASWSSDVNVTNSSFHGCWGHIQGGSIQAKAGRMRIVNSAFVDSGVSYSGSTCQTISKFDADIGWQGARSVVVLSGVRCSACVLAWGDARSLDPSWPCCLARELNGKLASL